MPRPCRSYADRSGHLVEEAVRDAREVEPHDGEPLGESGEGDVFVRDPAREEVAQPGVEPRRERVHADKGGDERASRPHEELKRLGRARLGAVEERRAGARRVGANGRAAQIRVHVVVVEIIVPAEVVLHTLRDRGEIGARSARDRREITARSQMLNELLG